MAEKQDQQMLIQAQMFQQQLQSIMAQKENMNMQLMEVKKALEELETVKTSSDVYKITGPILIKSDKKDVEKELKEKQESIDLRLKTLTTNEEKLKTRFEEITKKLSQNISVGK